MNNKIIRLGRHQSQGKTSFSGLGDPATNTITTGPGVMYYFNPAAGISPHGDGPRVYPQAQRITLDKVLRYSGQIKKIRTGIKKIYTGPERPAYQWLSKAAMDHEIKRAKAIKLYVDNHYGKITDVIIDAMGGNIGTMKLAAGAVAGTVEGNTITAKNGVKFHFMDTMERSRINELEKLVNNKPDSTLLCLVSQSGTTYETLANYLLLLQEGKILPPANIIPMIGTADSPIGEMAKLSGYKPLENPMGDDLFVIPNWSETGGRWTGNTAEPSLMIALGGGDPEQWFEGYQGTIKDFLNRPLKNNAVMMGAMLDVAYFANGFKNLFTFAYGETLAAAKHALDQNVNESTPCLVDTEGNPFGNGLVHRFLTSPAAQHADMATLTEFTKLPVKLCILTVQHPDVSSGKPVSAGILGRSDKIPDVLKKRLGGMIGLRPSELMDAMAASTGAKVWAIGRPVEFVKIPGVNPKTMAALLAGQYIKTLVWGMVNNIDVTREMAFTYYKQVFGTVTDKKNRSVLKQGPADIFYNAVTGR
ncbi:hypothetical protein ACFL57_01425 [Candidatus Margulisiibacteriota bacterium]